MPDANVSSPLCPERHTVSFAQPVDSILQAFDATGELGECGRLPLKAAAPDLPVARRASLVLLVLGNRLLGQPAGIFVPSIDLLRQVMDMQPYQVFDLVLSTLPVQVDCPGKSVANRLRSLLKLLAVLFCELVLGGV